MGIVHWDLHKKKKTGGRRRIWRKKRKYELGRFPAETLLGDRKLKVVRAKGGNIKLRLLRDKFVNLVIPDENRVEKTEILRVIENKANREYSRRGIITKGAVIETKYGRAVVTSRPGQDGVINAVLIEKKT